VVPSVEVTLDRLDGLDHTVQFLVSCQDDKRTIDAGLARVWLETTRDKDLVMLFANLPYRRRRASRYQHLNRRARMPYEQHQDQDDNDAWEENNDAKRHRNARVAF
jgi:hypothetical protein